MILLSEETIINMVTEFHFSKENNRHILCNQVAKAQLKKMVEWLRKQQISYDHTGLIFLGMEEADWQDLLKEIE